mmetsp:Transcript_12840/g.17620  ORF Transcript_12840/g.17620 Transcript_12840/m.17620 type:complete len:215 (+) Transcript_12840:705-1349(+)
MASRRHALMLITITKKYPEAVGTRNIAPALLLPASNSSSSNNPCRARVSKHKSFNSNNSNSSFFKLKHLLRVISKRSQAAVVLVDDTNTPRAPAATCWHPLTATEPTQQETPVLDQAEALVRQQMTCWDPVPTLTAAITTARHCYTLTVAMLVTSSHFQIWVRSCRRSPPAHHRPPTTAAIMAALLVELTSTETLPNELRLRPCSSPARRPLVQ